ncbi:MAG: DNA N-glycosylase and apurinic/apyrimidinic (AP) lyase [Pycnora praestabilis]|nr:MAG: DNA N-glycosylase and apurinic/apyrimidinic (AP) lyase [Pycnora praestabilis]
MRTSRIAHETFKVIKVQDAPREIQPGRRQTRAFAAALGRYARDGDSTTTTTTTTRTTEVKQEVHDGSDSELSSALSVHSADSEDMTSTLPPPSSRKRKRGTDTPLTGMTSSISSSTTETLPVGKVVIAHHDDDDDSPNVVKKPKRARKQPAKRTVTEDGEVEIHAPPNWEEVYDAVKEQRRKIVAPVDTMGCETLAEEKMSPRDRRFQTLIALMLSSQTKDTTTAAAITNLQTRLPAPGLTLSNILTVDPATLNDLIYAVGFHNNKTRYIKATAVLLHADWNDDIPDTIEGLMSLPGVGPKMAYLCMSAAWGRTEGIGVDVHVHRITNLWGWHRTSGPEETRLVLQAWLPRDRWHEINHLLVGFGQMVCLPVGRRCDHCVLGQRSLCPSAVVGRKEEVRKKRMKKEGSVVVKAEGGGEVCVDGQVVLDKQVLKSEEMQHGVEVEDLEDFGQDGGPERPSPKAKAKARLRGKKSQMIDTS